MTDEIELVGDEEGAIVAGSSSAVERFLNDSGLTSFARRLDAEMLGRAAQVGSNIASTLAGIAEQSTMYIKLTPESAKRLKDAGGLMPTKTKGVSHVMLGQTGKSSLKWVQAQDSPSSLLTNPAVVSGLGGLLSQAAQQAEAQDLKDLLLRIDEKLDDVRRKQRDVMLAQMKGAAASIKQACTVRDYGGDPTTWWDAVSGVPKTLFAIQEEALLELSALADKVREKKTSSQLKKATHQIERDVAVQVAVLARCFELQDEFGVLELDYVRLAAPDRLDGHRRGVEAARADRRSVVLESTKRLMSQLDSAGGIVNANILLHAAAAKAVVASLNDTATVVDDFHAPLGIPSVRAPLSATPWREALIDPAQRRTAAKEVGRNVLVSLAVLGGAVATYATTTALKNGGKPTV